MLTFIWYLGISIVVLLISVRWLLKKWWGSVDKSNEIRVKGKTVLITGASSGLGLATALHLAYRDANVILACRNLQKAKDAISYIRSKTSRGQLIEMKLDLSSIHSVVNFAKEFNGKYDKLDILINNAGVMVPPEKKMKTEDGFEIHFQVNYLSHFLLTNLLLKPIKNASPSRIVNVSSMAHSWGGPMDFDDIMCEKITFPSTSSIFPSKLYSNSKLANALFSKELGKRLDGTGVRTYALCPGMVFTEIGRDLNVSWLMHMLRPLFWYLLKSPEEGAATTLYCSLSKNLANESGQMYQNCKYWDPKTRIELTEGDAAKLWNISERVVGLKSFL